MAEQPAFKKGLLVEILRGKHQGQVAVLANEDATQPGFWWVNPLNKQGKPMLPVLLAAGQLALTKGGTRG